MDRRRFIKTGVIGSTAFGIYSSLGAAPVILPSWRLRPKITHGVTSGDVDLNSAVLWARCDRPARLHAELSTRPDFAESQKFQGTAALESNDFNAHAFPSALLPDSRYYYRLRFQSSRDPDQWSRYELGEFSTASASKKSLRFCWSGDTAGQGFGIDQAHGGMLTYAAMARRAPDFFVHSGDLIYADNPMKPEVTLDDGSIWKNQLVEAKTRVAESTQDFRENFYYNLTDDHVSTFLRKVPVIQQWDDHEVVNNWYPSEILESDDRYTLKNVAQLAANARQAFFDTNPIRPYSTDPTKIYRKISRGPLLDLFVIDLRSYRGPNTTNLQSTASAETAFLGQDQLRWLQEALQESTAVWKIVCSDMPIGLVIKEWGREECEGGANGDAGPPLGRELELAALFRSIAENAVENVHFITADVHYCASHYYNPAKAAFKDFKPFWEFVSGPLHAGTFGPNALDDTFGPEETFRGIPEGLPAFRAPSEGYQFFGEMEIDGASEALTVRHFNRAGDLLWEKQLQPESESLSS